MADTETTNPALGSADLDDEELDASGLEAIEAIELASAQLRGTDLNLDRIDWSIVAELQRDGRLPFAELARRVHLDEVEAVDRVRQLELGGVISGYRAMVDLPNAGLPVSALIRLVLPTQRPQPLGRVLAERKEITECLWIADEGCYFLRVATTSHYHLQELVDCLNQLGKVTTSVITAATLPSRGVYAPVPASC